MPTDNEKWPKSDWQMEAYNGETVLGYAEWVQHKEEDAQADLDHLREQKNANDVKIRLQNTAFDTVGYAESSNKEEFRKGAMIAITKAQDHYEKELKNARQSIAFREQEAKGLREDLEKMSDIIERYSRENR